MTTIIDVWGEYQIDSHDADITHTEIAYQRYMHKLDIDAAKHHPHAEPSMIDYNMCLVRFAV